MSPDKKILHTPNNCDKKNRLDFGCLKEVEIGKKKGKGYASALFALNPSGSGDGIGKADEKGFLFEPVVRGSCPKGLKLMGAPQGGTILPPKGVEGPALGALPPASGNGRRMQ